eukprot:3690165-Prorocentrum_lima.AAC.1
MGRQRPEGGEGMLVDDRLRKLEACPHLLGPTDQGRQHFWCELRVDLRDRQAQAHVHWVPFSAEPRMGEKLRLRQEVNLGSVPQNVASSGHPRDLAVLPEAQ